ncbi:MAG: DUF5115 domain-containing protein [Bacteroidales bacterium]|nr:DUF5115 domain-containing protein [Bacteroidales bacterium]
MNKKFLYAVVLGAAAFAACTDDYKDWSEPKSVPQESPVSFGDGSVSSVGTIDFRTLEAEMVKVCNINAPTASVEGYAPQYKITLSTADNILDAATYDITTDGFMSADALQRYLEDSYGKRPEERELLGVLSVWQTSSAASIRMNDSQPFAIKAIPEAPEIEEVYYLTGNFNGWNNSNTDYALTNGGGDVYENPVFTVTFNAPADLTEDLQFKVTPASGLGGDWSKCLGNDEDNPGKFKYNNEGGNFVVPYDPDALFYRVTFDMMNMTWNAAALSFNEYIYEIGNESGWSTPHALRSPASDGLYKGYYYLDGQFKFKPNENDWDGDWEYLGDNRIGQGSDNCPDPGAGFYEINVDLTSMTYNLVTINQIGLIGDFNSWGGDVDLTYNTATGAWEVKGVELPKGGVKFRVNGDWAINFGGDLNGLTQDGPNISVSAGTYDISLILSTEGNHKAVFTETSGAGEQFSDFIYYAGSANGWDANASPMAHEGAGVYRGWYYVLPDDGETTWGFKFVDGSWYGDAGDGKLSTEGGNINIAEGFYMLVADMANLTYEATPATIGLIGDATRNGWDGDTEMTFDTTLGCWTYTGELATGKFKFRANGDWTFNWGGDLTNLTYNGGDIAIEAGTYTIKFWPNCEGKAYATVE